LVAPSEGDAEDEGDRGEGDGDGEGGVGGAAPDDEGAGDGEVDGHGQVLDDEQVQDCGGLSVAEAVEVGEDLGDDPGGADPADTAEQQGRCGFPAEEQADEEGRGEVGGGVDDAWRQSGA